MLIGMQHDAAAAEPASRHFRMGFTGFVHDITPEAVAATPSKGGYRKHAGKAGGLLPSDIGSRAATQPRFRDQFHPSGLRPVVGKN